MTKKLMVENFLEEMIQGKLLLVSGSSHFY